MAKLIKDADMLRAIAEAGAALSARDVARALGLPFEEAGIVRERLLSLRDEGYLTAESSTDGEENPVRVYSLSQMGQMLLKGQIKRRKAASSAAKWGVTTAIALAALALAVIALVK